MRDVVIFFLIIFIAISEVNIREITDRLDRTQRALLVIAERVTPEVVDEARRIVQQEDQP